MKISQLPALADSSLGPDMLFPTVAGGVTQKISTEQLRNLCMSGFYFPAHPSLTPADSGKIVVNVNGMAKVANTGGETPGTTGKWEIKSATLITAPKQAVWDIKVTGVPIANETFTIYGHTFIFVSGTASSVNEIPLGATVADTVTSMAECLTVYGDDLGYFTATAPGPTNTYVTAGNAFAGQAGNAINFSTTSMQLSCTQVTTGVDFDLYNTNTPFLRWKKDGETYQITLGEACSASAPAGTLLGGYKWPANATDQLKNILYGLNHAADFTDYFTATETASIVVNENTAPTGELTSFSSQTGHTTTTLVDPSSAGIPAYVQDVVLGQLMYIYEGKALISNDRTLRVRLSPDSAPIVFTTPPAHPLYRALMYANDGTVTGPVPFSDGLSTEFFGNGLLFALEEGNPGDDILVQPFFFIGGG